MAFAFADDVYEDKDEDVYACEMDFVAKHGARCFEKKHIFY